MKICLIASSGGHYEQLLMLKKLADEHEVFYVTEKTDYHQNEKNTYFLQQVNRREWFFLFYILKIFIKSGWIFFKERPDTIISTGVLAAIPMMILGKLFRKKIIYIESFAKISDPTQTGKLIYKFADTFVIQWESLKKYYPNAIYLGSLY
ncbi:PssD/Cps14F family polysaccharide biosynthesis glycosyltransferase [Candidatus Enterococcus courvalinii]|uniref:Polysaccharide biosynthesis protein n=1 Tax=Candidatus Enterococcus courvalinii TaxID=2815329 RepID=A0ABS3HX07_9ENTE|nr:PssD/Cps14F family polysaccharide biosynthesis glycosyltransferase [Enterococcus sp. MSG2901]MBO0481008.1 polysaccharide biosynthesis protein [Enterococcus sp. MSG2901]